MNENLKFKGWLEHYHFGGKLVFTNVFGFYGHKLAAKQAFVHSTFPFLDFLSHIYKFELNIV
jgi:hypothetical protein